MVRVTMRLLGNVDALGAGRLVISNDDASPVYGLEVCPDKAPFADKRVTCLGSVGRAAAPLWLTAAFFAATWASDAQATDASRSGDTSARLAQASTRDPTELQSTPDQGQQKAEMLARELAVARRDLELLRNLLNKARDEQARVKQAGDKEAAELRKALQEERDRGVRPNQEADSSADELRKSMLRDRAERMERDLAAMRHGVQPQTAPADSGTPDLRKSLQQERDRAIRLEQDLAAARRDVETQTALSAKAKDEASKLKQARDSGSAELQKSLQQERERASRLEQDLAAARRDVETQTAQVANAKDEASKLKQAKDSGRAELQESLQQERERASRLEQDLAAARRDVETQTARVVKAKDEASELKQAKDSGSAELQKSLQQERERASRLEQDLATARRDVEMQTALAAKAKDEASQLKQAAERGSAELMQSLQREQDKAATLAQELTTERARITAYESQVRRAEDQAEKLKQAESGTEDLRKSLQHEQERASQLEQDLAAARRDVETQTALAEKASVEATKLKQAGESGAAELQKALQQERDRAESLARDLSTARTEVYAYQAKAASDQAAGLEQAAESGAEGLRKSLQQEHERATALAQELAAAQRHLEMQTELAAKASAEANQLKQAADSGSAELKQSLQKEHDRAEALAQDLSMVHAAIYAYEAQARKTSDQTAGLEQTWEGNAWLRKSLVEEWEREARLQNDLAAARRNLETQTALAEKASAEATTLKQAADSGAERSRKSLQHERDRVRQLEQDLATAQHDVETRMALAESAHPEASRLKQVAEQNSTELRRSFQRERDKAARSEGALALAQGTKDASAVTGRPIVPEKQIEANMTTPVTTGQVAAAAERTDSELHPEDAAEVARLVTRASRLLRQGDIGAARIVLERAAEAGNALANFVLAETYDPLVLPKWGTYGTRGDAAKARDLYAKAQAGGIREAKDRVDALRQQQR